MGKNPIITDSGTGKIIYKNSNTGKQIVHDYHANYFRIEDTLNSSKRRFLNLDGNPLINKTLPSGKIQGISKDEFQKLSHFNMD